MYKKILVATDSSRHATEAVRVACELASKLGCHLDIVTVMGDGELPANIKHYIDVEHMADPPVIEVRDPVDVGMGVAYLRSIGETGIRRHQAWSALADKTIDDATNTAREYEVTQVDTMIEEGDVVAAIMKTIEAKQPNLVILGRRGVSDLSGLLMGSVTHKISHLVNCDVLTVMAE